jgi:hypothetical protein
MLQHLADLWGYDVVLQEHDELMEGIAREHLVHPKVPAGRPPAV